MKNKAFIFDWSGTLSNNFDLFYKVYELMFKELGKEPLSVDDIKTNFTLPYMNFWNKHFPDLTKEKQDKLYEKYIHEVGEPELYENVDIIINYLHEKGYKLFILSSDPISKLLPEIAKNNFAKLITKTVGFVHYKDVVIKEFVENFDLDKNQTFYIGDTIGDIEAGKSAQVKTVGASWGFQYKDILAKANPDFLINDILEIKSIVE